MRRIKKLGWTYLGGSCLLLSIIALPADDLTGFVEISEAQDPEMTRSVPAPPQGIVSYGTGAARLGQPGTIGVAVATGEAQEATSAGASVKISGTSMAGDAVAFALSPNGQTAVYIADQDTLGQFELYSAAVDGSATPTKISAGLPFGAGDQGVSVFRISPDGANVVFLADPNAGAGNDDIFSVPIDGSASPEQLNLAGQRPITALGVFPNSTLVAFFGISGTSVELFKATINSSSSATQLSNAGPSGSVVAADFSLDSARVLYAAGPVFQWYSVPTDGSGPVVQLSDALGFVSLGAITPDSSTLVYTADENLLGVSELFSVPIDGPHGTSVNLNPSMAGDGVTSFRVGPNSLRVAYLADQDTAGTAEAYSALIGSSGSVKLNGTLTGEQFVRSVAISPDGATVVYEADENTEGTIDVLVRPIDGSGTPSTLHALTAPENAGSFSGLGTPIIGSRTVYPVIKSGAEIETEINLFSTPIDATQTSAQVNDLVAIGDLIFNAFIPSVATRLMAWGTGATDDGITQDVFVGPIRSDLTPEQINVSATATALGAQGYEISSNENYAVYLQDQTTTGKVELYSCALDSDGDTVPNASDNCKFMSNSSQNSLLFGQTVLALSGTTFGWSSPTDVRFARGPLADLDTPVADESGSLIWASSYTDTDQPASAGTGFYYLFGLDCSGGSYQTALGAEPLRDTLP